MHFDFADAIKIVASTSMSVRLPFSGRFSFSLTQS